MPVSVARAQQHVIEWSKKLSAFQVRSNWPNHLFHTCQLDVAIEIVKKREILCRGQLPALIWDVANQGAIQNNLEAHKYARLYFRPRNSYHLKTEGVKSGSDPNRIDPHMAIPIAFAFDFVKVIALENSGFVPGNFARTGAEPLKTDAEFDRLPFDLIYHDSAPPKERMSEIHNWRMSEVAIRDHLSLDYLSYVICRTIHEERTLRFGLRMVENLPKIIVEQKGSIFMRRGIFIDEIYLLHSVMHMKFHGPVNSPKDKYKVEVNCNEKGNIERREYDIAPGLYKFPNIPATATAIWKIIIEGCIVYHAEIPAMSGLVSPP